MTIRTLGGSKRCRVGPGRARIPATRVRVVGFPEWRGAFCRDNRPVGPDYRVVRPHGLGRAADKIGARSQVSMEGIGREIS